MQSLIVFISIIVFTNVIAKNGAMPATGDEEIGEIFSPGVQPGQVTLAKQVTVADENLSNDEECKIDPIQQEADKMGNILLSVTCYILSAKNKQGVLQMDYTEWTQKYNKEAARLAEKAEKLHIAPKTSALEEKLAKKRVKELIQKALEKEALATAVPNAINGLIGNTTGIDNKDRIIVVGEILQSKLAESVKQTNGFLNGIKLKQKTNKSNKQDTKKNNLHHKIMQKTLEIAITLGDTFHTFMTHHLELLTKPNVVKKVAYKINDKVVGQIVGINMLAKTCSVAWNTIQLIFTSDEEQKGSETE